MTRIGEERPPKPDDRTGQPCRMVVWRNGQAVPCAGAIVKTLYYGRRTGESMRVGSSEGSAWRQRGFHCDACGVCYIRADVALRREPHGDEG